MNMHPWRNKKHSQICATCIQISQILQQSKLWSSNVTQATDLMQPKQKNPSIKCTDFEVFLIKCADSEMMLSRNLWSLVTLLCNRQMTQQEKKLQADHLATSRTLCLLTWISALMPHMNNLRQQCSNNIQGSQNQNNHNIQLPMLASQILQHRTARRIPDHQTAQFLAHHQDRGPQGLVKGLEKALVAMEVEQEWGQVWELGSELEQQGPNIAPQMPAKTHNLCCQYIQEPTLDCHKPNMDTLSNCNDCTNRHQCQGTCSWLNSLQLQ